MSTTKQAIVDIIVNHGPMSAYSIHRIGEALDVRDRNGRKWTRESVRSRCVELAEARILVATGKREPTGRGGTAKVWGIS
jgi:hypothetical protein